MKSHSFFYRSYIILLLLSLAADIRLFPVSIMAVKAVPLSTFTIFLGLVFPILHFEAFGTFLRSKKELLLFVGLLFLAGIISALFSPFPMLLGVKLLLRYALFFIAAFLLLFLFSLDKGISEEFYLKSLVGIGLVLAVFSFIEVVNAGFSRFLADTFRAGEIMIANGKVRVGATLAHPNIFGCFMSLCILVLVRLKEKHALNARMFYPAVSLLAVAMALSESRNAICVLFIPIFILLFDRKMLKTAVVVIGISLVALFITSSGSRIVDLTRAPQALSESLVDAADRPKASNSVTTRIFLWRSAVRMFADYPVTGIGPGGYNRALRYYAFPEHLAIEKARIEKEYLNAHNFFFNVLAQFGLVGIAALTAFLAYLARYLFADRSFLKPSSSNALLLGLVISFAFDDFIYNQFYMVVVVSLIFMLAFPADRESSCSRECP